MNSIERRLAKLQRNRPKWLAHQRARALARREGGLRTQTIAQPRPGEWFIDDHGNPSRIVSNEAEA